MIEFFLYFLRLLSRLLPVTGQLSLGKAFPKALSPEEEKDLIHRFYVLGDKSAREELIERNLRLVAHIVKKYNNADEDPSDLISIGTIGLIKAIDSFDAKRQTRIAPYASRCINNEILMSIRAEKHNKNNIFLSDTITQDKDGEEMTYQELIESTEISPQTDLENKVQLDYLMKVAIHILDPREKEIILMRYGFTTGKCETQLDVAEKLNISRSYVSRIEKAALEKLRRNLDENL